MKDHRGFPIPWFVQWMKEGQEAEDGEAGAAPDFRVINSPRMERC